MNNKITANAFDRVDQMQSMMGFDGVIKRTQDGQQREIFNTRDIKMPKQVVVGVP